MIYLRRLLESRPYFNRIPDDSLIVSENGSGGTHMSATRSDNGSYALIYFPDAVSSATLDLSKLNGPTLKAWWYDTHTGLAQLIGELPNHGAQTFTVPLEWHGWVLVLDETAAGFAAPGVK